MSHRPLSESDHVFVREFSFVIGFLAIFALCLLITAGLIYHFQTDMVAPNPRANANANLAPIAAVYAGESGAAAVAATTPGPAAGAAKQPAPSGPYSYDAAKGKSLYTSTCSACHQATGLGLPNTFPPLKGNPLVTQADPTEQIHVALFGKTGPATVLGKKYDGAMPGFGDKLSDTDVANLLNYERSSWGNHGKHMTPKQVSAVRAKGK